MVQPRVTPDVPRPRGLRQRIRDLSALQLGVGYAVLYFFGGGMESSVIAPGHAASHVVLLPWLALVALIALLRDDKPLDAALLLSVMSAGTVLLTLLLRAAATESVRDEMSAWRFSYLALPAAVGVVMGVNTGLVVAIVRFIQRRRKERLLSPESSA